MSVRVVNLGLPKSGTTTLATALRAAGWRVADHKLRHGEGHPAKLSGTFVGRQIYDGYFETGDPLARLDRFDALTEISGLKGARSFWPQCDFAVLKAMRVARPGLLFVATIRPAEAISDSMRRWQGLGEERLPGGAVPGLPAGYGATDAQRVRWIAGHYHMLRDVFGDDPRFLELDVAGPDARARLAAHLGIDLPWWGRANVNPVRA